MSGSAGSSGDAYVVPYPPEFVEAYRASGIWADRTIADEFSAIAATHADLPALSAPDVELSYAELDSVSDRIACGVHGLGLEPGERVLLQVANTGWAVIAWYGLLKAGLVPVATLAQHRRHEIFDIAAQCEPAAHLVQTDFRSQSLVALARETAAERDSLRFVLTLGEGEAPAGSVAIESLASAGARDDRAAREAVEEIQRRIPSDSLGVLQLSGGTTATPKLIPRLHTEYWYNARAYADAIGLDADGCVAHLLPVIHNAGIVCGVHAAHSVGGCFALCPHEGEQLKALARGRAITHMVLPPPLAQMIQADPELRAALSDLRAVTWVLGPLADDVLETFETGGCRVIQMFGMGEGTCMVTPPDAKAAIRHGTVGTPLCELDEVRVYAPGSEDPVALGERGELCCRGPYTIRGYYRAEARNAEAFTSDGFYRTGDLVSEVREGDTSYYRLEDRIKDLINRGGEKVNAAEVEGLLIRHPAIARAALVGMPDPRLGERACAFVVAAGGDDAPDVAQLQEFLDNLGVAKFKWPERVEVRDALPMTSIDKVNKVALRDEIRILLATAGEA